MRRSADETVTTSRRRWALLSILGLASLTLTPIAAAADEAAIPDYIKAALASPARSDADRKSDMTRKPAELLAFAGVKPGDKVLELVPGGGYWEKLFSLIVGPKGHVYELTSEEEIASGFTKPEPIKAIAADPNFSNVTVITQPFAKIAPPEPVDLVWTVQNYHDMHNKPFGSPDMKMVDAALFAALKPGGAFFINDHAAAPGHGVQDTSTLHRIEPAAAIAEVESAGFKLEKQSDVLRNLDDDHTLKIFDAKMRGKTDKFTVLFRKPK